MKDIVSIILPIFLFCQATAFLIGIGVSGDAYENGNKTCKGIREDIFKPRNIASLISPGMYAGKAVAYLGCEFFTRRWE